MIPQASSSKPLASRTAWPRTVLAALTLAGLVAGATAAPLTYFVSRTIGAATVTGTVTTDGTLGVLNTANVTAWSLTFAADAASLAITQANSQFLASGSALTADADSMDFDFSAATGFFIFQNPTLGSGINFWCVNATNSSCTQNASSSEQLRFNGAWIDARQGDVEIATRSNGVPEPATLALAGLALLGVTAARRRA